ncbi:MAG: DNA glycosylase AlkZ-like family protein [Carbonactinosporaceae bacterium]
MKRSTTASSCELTYCGPRGTSSCPRTSAGCSGSRRHACRPRTPTTTASWSWTARSSRGATPCCPTPWAPHSPSQTRDAALAELTLRYFTGHGPATAKDFKWWSSLTLADIKRGLEMVGPRLERDVLDGVPYWFRSSARDRRARRTMVRLLPGFDEYIVGYGESRFALDVSGVARSLPQGRVIANGVIIGGSQVAGHWKRMLKKDSVVIEAATTTRFDPAQERALQAPRTATDSSWAGLQPW